MNEEPFGPIAPVSRFSDVDEVIAPANGLPYGLAAYAFTNSAAISARLSDEIQAGMLAINSLQIATPETPFGGIGWSGWGSEGGVMHFVKRAPRSPILSIFGVLTPRPPKPIQSPRC